MTAQGDSITQLLVDWSRGNSAALESLTPLVYEELRRIARRYLRREAANHTLQPTALVNEAYLKLVDQSRVDWKNRAHFFGVAASLMRRILVDHARRRDAEKRGGGQRPIALESVDEPSVEQGLDVLALNRALEELERIDPQQARVVELRFFCGLTVEETSDVLDISTATVKREWRFARAWLAREIQRNR